MKKTRVILFRWVSLVLVALLLFLAAGGQALRHNIIAPTEITKATPTKKAEKSTPTDTQISAASADAVVTPAISFDFGQSIFLIPQPVLVLFLLLTVAILRQFTLPHYFFSYLRHVFGHYIAPNAP
jgi:hypothetical protein